MSSRKPLAMALLLCLPTIGTVAAQSPSAGVPAHPPLPPVSAADRHAVLQSLATQLQAKYVFPDVAKELSKALLAKEAKGGYGGANDVGTFIKTLAADMRAIGKDGHFRVAFDPERLDHMPADSGAAPSKEEFERQRQFMASVAYGVERVQVLPGNIGYLEVRGFGPPEIVGAAFTSAITILAGTDALILDLRRNGGGEPAGVANLLSHFFPEGDARHLNDLYFRPKNETVQFWTDAGVLPRYSKPVYVLTSGRTFSGGEECAYDFQTQKRATLVGEITGGGANPGDMVSLGHGFGAFIPTGRAINPITRTNWEHFGVKPDIEVPAAQAQFEAQKLILRDLLAKATDPDQREELQDALTRAEKGEVETPHYERQP